MYEVKHSCTAGNKLIANPRERLLLAKEFLELNFAEKTSLDKLSKIALLSPRYFLRFFKKEFNITPHQYLTLQRVNKAKELLYHHHSVSDVCKMVGFDDLSSFSKLFKRYTGYTPSEYAC